MNYKEATGVRARTDLSANARSGEPCERLTDEQLIKFAEWMMQTIRTAEDQDLTQLSIPVRFSRKLVDATLEVVNRRGVR